MIELLGTKPELAYLQLVASLDANPAAPLNIKKNPTVFDRLMGRDFKSAWEALTPEDQVKYAGKAKPTLRSVTPGLNMVRKIYKYEKPYCDETVEAPIGICAVTNTTNDNYGYLEVGIDNTAFKSWKVKPSDLANFNQSVAMRRADQLRRAAYALKVDANKKLITQMLTMVSSYADGTSGLTATKNLVILSDKGDIVPTAKVEISREYRKSLYSGETVIFGGETLMDYFEVKSLRISPEGKIGVEDQLANMPFIYDSSLDPIIQAAQPDTLSHALVVPIGSIILDTYNKNIGDEAINLDGRLSTVIEIDGMMYDYDMYFEPCDKVYHESISLHWGVGSIPDAAYCNGRGLVKHYTTSCGPVSCV